MKSNIILPPKIDTYIPYLPIENVAHFNANDNSLPYYIPIVYRYIYILCVCWKRLAALTLPSQRHLHHHPATLRHHTGCATIICKTVLAAAVSTYYIEWDGKKTTQFFYRGVESIYEVVVSKLNYL